MLLTVVHVDGSKRGQTETFEQPIVAVGRDPANQLLFDAFKDQDVSARHAQFVIQGAQLMIQDMNSRNGTFLNGARVGAQPVPVPSGAVVQFGDKGPKVQVSFKAAAAGPGKKTMMIADLEGKLTQQQKSGSKTLACAIVAMILLLVLAVGGLQLSTIWSKRKADEAACSQAMADVPGARKAAENVKAADLAAATWKSAQDLEAKGEADRKAGKLADAAHDFTQAIEAYKQAKSESEGADLKNQILALNEELKKKAAERQEQQVQANVERQKELDEKKAADDKVAQEQVEKLKKELEATKTAAEMGPLVDAALAASKVAQVQSVLDKVKQKLTEGGANDQLTKWQDQLSKHLDDLKSIGPRLDKAAQDAKPRVVAIQVTSYMLPKGQTEKTTQIREFLTSASGTGFFVGKDKVATAKELVEPWKFDPAALALKKKWDEFSYKVSTKIDVLVLNQDGVYTVAATSDPAADNPTVTTIYVGADAFQDDAIDQKVSFRGADSVEKVQPHKRDSSNIAVLQIKGQTQTPLPLAPSDDALKTGDSGIALGQKADVKPDQLRLFSQQADLTAPGTFGVGGFATWTGGPVLDANGNVTGLIVKVEKDSMNLVPPSRIKEAAGN
jgi:hypothetical protein